LLTLEQEQLNLLHYTNDKWKFQTKTAINHPNTIEIALFGTGYLFIILLHKKIDFVSFSSTKQ